MLHSSNVEFLNKYLLNNIVPKNINFIVVNKIFNSNLKPVLNRQLRNKYYILDIY